MYGVDGIHGGNGLQPLRKSNISTPSATTSRGDSIELSKDALTAAVAASESKVAETPDVMEERIAAAKRSIEEGTYKLQHVVLQVAARIADVIEF
jgi:anti-sigma28 factor (negative regulator of flagellin synthesis)